MMFVALAIFEYAVLLAIRFGRGKRIQIEREDATENKVNKCKFVDRISLIIFMAIYIFTVCSYFYTVTIHNK